ncbi:unnamed protein product [Heligmosomoides polygyrus]|uniref:CARD domain-containing protein n=1 Tax=Heligmosomoides polygyrus TaxID=6339 RepID=A0A183FUF1_HELPZ|nr:unnamed protein product [Heligmosomoides polygyrus]
MEGTNGDHNMIDCSDDDERKNWSVESVSSSKRFPDMLLNGELEEIKKAEGVPEVVREQMVMHKVSHRYKDRHSEVVKKEVDRAGEMLGKLISKCKATWIMHKKLLDVLERRGIETEDDWDQYVRTTKRDGEILADVCDALDTDMFQVVRVAQEAKASVDAMPRSTANGTPNCEVKKGNRPSIRDHEVNTEIDRVQLQNRDCSTGQYCEHKWRYCAETSWEDNARASGQSLAFEMISGFQSLYCADPGVYKGKDSENFKEFIRRFRRKYQRAVFSDQTLIEILGDDHLGGRTMNVFLSLLVEVRRKGSEEVVTELGKLLAEDSVAGRMRVVAGLHELRMRLQQDVAEFCVVPEKLAKKAYPEGNMENHLLEFAHTLLSNLKDWPEHIQLLSALHKVK